MPLLLPPLYGGGVAMDCPLLLRGVVIREHYEEHTEVCPQGRCAWWDWENGCCAVLALARHFQAVAEHYPEERRYRPTADRAPRVRQQRRGG